MTTASGQPWPAGEWRTALAEAVTDFDELLGVLALDPACLGDRGAAELSSSSFALRVPRSYLSRIRPGDPHDPLLRQVLASAAEQERFEGFVRDPLGEASARPRGGVMRKYRGRALVLVSGACAVHCRYCFRRHFPYQQHAGFERWAAAAVAIARDPSIDEVILSGGDPLTVTDDLLGELAWLLAQAPHVRRLRIHTRLPVVLPSRVDSGLVGWLERLPVPVVVVVHANHAREIDADVGRALGVLGSTVAAVLNQAVLLRGVNDDVTALCELSERLFEHGVLPYYLHMLDRVEGAGHFAVSGGAASRLVAGVRAALPGYLVPRLVREIPGAAAKVPVDLRH